MLTTNVGVTTTYFVGAHYEVTNGLVTKYYFAGTQRIAMRKNSVLSYLLSDHLGSTSLVTDASGAVISNTKYKAWGETRYSSGSEVTDYQYTGQYSYESDFGLYFYNARFYDPLLGRFSSPDSIIPDENNSQSWDRYAYTFNNPIIYNDPSGHDPNPWNPFAFNTIVIQIALNIELPVGINVNLIEFVIDTTAFKEYEFDIYNIELPQPEIAVTTSATGTAGFQINGAALGTIYGTDESVDEIINNNVSTILDDSTLPVHGEVCYEYCLGLGYTFDPSDPNWSAGESVSYSAGFGYGASIGLDVVEARDWVAYYSSEKGVKVQLPTRYKEYISEAARDFGRILIR